jgi:phage tail-like protein
MTQVVSANAFSLNASGFSAVFTQCEIDSSAYALSTTTKSFTATTAPVVTLTRPVGDLSLWAWLRLVQINDPTCKKSCVLTVLSASGTTAAAFALPNAWPIKVIATAAPAGSAAPMLETITLTCDFVQRES